MIYMRQVFTKSKRYFSSFIGICTICMVVWTIFGLAYVYANESPSTMCYSYEDEDMFVRAEADGDILPEDATFHVDQIPNTSLSQEQSTDFHEAISKVEQTGHDIKDAFVYDSSYKRQYRWPK